MANSPKLTDREESFAIEYTINRGNKAQAFRDSYDCEHWTNGAIYVEACRLAQVPKVALRIAELRKQRFSKKILSIDERKVLLSEWAEEGDSKSVDLLNKMEGVYIEKIEQKVTDSSTVVNIVEDKRDE